MCPIPIRDWSREWAAAPPLEPGAVHAWRAWLDTGEALVRAEGVLADGERARAASLAPAAGRAFVAGRVVLREVLGSYLGLPPARVAFREGPSGKPALAGGGRLLFSVSHAGGLLLVAVGATVALGIDVERLRPIANRERIAGRFFLASEHAALLATPPAAREEAFFRAWTRKEACSKALGGDLVPALARFEVAIGPGAPARLVRIDGDAAAAGRWSLCDLDPAPGHVGALAWRNEG